MELLPHVDVSRDRNFQRKYNAFYRVRQRSEGWYEQYCAYLESGKASPPSFDSTIHYMFSALGRCEPSFCSKLVATLNPHQPVWDKFVLRNTNQEPPPYGTKDRVARAKVVYRNIQNWYEQYLPSLEARYVVSVFNREVQDHHRITNLKKIDFVLWQIRA
ncbi:MAG: hypothetical protein HY735_12920 [Verrucomicrobia bacterium]|nr:hypothetical protein [Verrucomicrobiota bacterium]